MKTFFILYHSLSDFSRILFDILLALSFSLVTLSFICFNFAEYSGVYYDIRVLSFELITLLRSTFFILSAGIVITNYIEKNER